MNKFEQNNVKITGIQRCKEQTETKTWILPEWYVIQENDQYRETLIYGYFQGQKTGKNNCQNLQSTGDNFEINDYRSVKVTTE